MWLVGLGLMLAGVATARWAVRATEKRPTSESDLPVFIGAALIAGGAMMTIVSVAILVTSAM
jgi:hypothetical protein